MRLLLMNPNPNPNTTTAITDRKAALARRVVGDGDVRDPALTEARAATEISR